MADSELAIKLQKQIIRNESSSSFNSSCSELPSSIKTHDENTIQSMRVFNPYTEFKEFGRKEIQNLEKTFKK